MENYQIQGTTIVSASCTRIPKEERDKTLYYYDVRHDDNCKGEAVMLRPFVMVNHWGTIVTEQPLNFFGDNCIYLSKNEGETINMALSMLDV